MAAPKGNRFWEARTSHGRPPEYESDDDLWKDCVEYFEWVVANPWKKTDYRGKDCKEVKIPTERPMTLQGLATFLGIALETWCQWRKKREDLSDVITRVEQIIYTQKFEGAAVGAFNANIIARDLGLKDQQEIDFADVQPATVVFGVKDASKKKEDVA